MYNVPETRYSHSQEYNLLGSNGLKILHGQDLTYGDRKRLQQLQQQDWVRQQIQEKQRKKELMDEEKRLYSDQSKQVTELRTALQRDKAMKLTTLETAVKESNLQQLEQKLDRDRQFRRQQAEARLDHLNYITNHDFYTENTETCGSMLGKHRVLPYHWKGMNDQQKKAILLQQQRQRQQNQAAKDLEKQKERLYAEQEKHLRKMVLLEDKKKKKGSESIRKAQDQYNLHKNQEMKRKIPHAYAQIQTFKNE